MAYFTGPMSGDRQARSSLKALGKPLLFAEALNFAFPRPGEPKDKFQSENAVSVSNADLAKLIANRLGLSETRQKTLQIQLGKYRTGKDIPNRRMIGMLSEGLGVPPMVLALYAGRFEEFFAYIKTLAELETAPAGWPLGRRSSPLRAAFAIALATFPNFNNAPSVVSRQATTALHMFMHGPERLGYDVGDYENRTSNSPLVEYLAGSTTDGAFLLPAHPSRKDLHIRSFGDDSDVTIIYVTDPHGETKNPLPTGIKEYDFDLRAECQIDISGSLATWIYKNVEPKALTRKDMLRRALDALNDADYPVLERFELAGFICDQWAQSIDGDLQREVLSNLWRWDGKGLNRAQASQLLQEKTQHARRKSAYPRRRNKPAPKKSHPASPSEDS